MIRHGESTWNDTINSGDVSKLVFLLFYIQLYIKEGGYQGAELDIDQWTWIANVTVLGQGMSTPSYLPIKSFKPILLRKYNKIGFYIATAGLYRRSTNGDVEGKPYAANPDVVIYQGVGKRRPMTSGTVSPRIFTGAFGYHVVGIPTQLKYR